MKTTSPISVTVCRWVARIVSALLVAVMVILLIKKGMPHPLMHPGSMSMIALVGFVGIVLILVGFLAGWRWELAGGVLSLVGICLMYGPTRVNGKVTWFLCSPGRAGSALHHKSLTEEVRFEAFKDPTTRRIQRLKSTSRRRLVGRLRRAHSDYIRSASKLSVGRSHGFDSTRRLVEFQHDDGIGVALAANWHRNLDALFGLGYGSLTASQ